MEKFLNIKNLKMALGFAIGFVLYDYFAHGQVDWIRAIIVSILTVIFMTIFKGLKK